MQKLLHSAKVNAISRRVLTLERYSNQPNDATLSLQHGILWLYIISHDEYDISLKLIEGQKIPDYIFDSKAKVEVVFMAYQLYVNLGMFGFYVLPYEQLKCKTEKFSK